MSDQSLSATELELTAAKAEEHAAEIAAGGRLNTLYRWPEALARTCWQALAQAAEIERLRTVLASIQAMAERDLCAGVHAIEYSSLPVIEVSARTALEKEPPC